MSSVAGLADATRSVNMAALTLIDSGISVLGDDDVIAATVAAGALLRRAESLLLELSSIVEARSSAVDEDRLDRRYGCRNAVEVLERATGVAGATARKWLTTARGVARRETLQGAELPAVLPAVRASMLAGSLGVDGVAAISAPLLDVRDRISAGELWRADEELACIVTAGPAAGTFATDGSDFTLPTPADTLRAEAMKKAFLLDQDGAEPTEARARIARSLSLGRLRDGTVPLSGKLLPEVAAQLQSIIDAITNPHGQAAGVRFIDSADVDAGRDDRTPAQARHDALATALTVAAASRELPTIGGAAPTLVVTVEARALEAQHGWAQAGTYPTPLATAHHVSCGGVIQRIIIGDNGQVLAMATEARTFNAWQRRAIAARDGGCVIPGCTVPAAWCEVHHIIPWALGGRTDVSNGTLLCWAHHRYIDTNGWRLRIHEGTVEVAPPPWIDPTGTWRPARRRAPALL